MSAEFGAEFNMPKSIKVVSRGSHPTLVIDGREFPWMITDEGVRVNVTRDRIPCVTISIPAESVETIHEFNAPPETNEQRKARLVRDMQKRPA